MISLTSLANKLFSAESVAIIMHIRPDGDALGSSLALAAALEKSGVKTEVFCADPVPEKFGFLKNVSRVKTEFFGEYTYLVACDCADVSRMGALGEIFVKNKPNFNIDHHVSNTHFARHNYVMDKASNCENVYALINEAGAKIDEGIANLLATGVVTDTGGFVHKNVTAETLETASALVKLGADLNAITYNCFKKQTKARAALFARVMSKIRYFADDAFAVATVAKKDLEETGAKADETEGFIDFVMGIDCVKVGACVMETGENKYKISFRSKGTDVNAVAGVFGGGGHVLASGCQIFGEYEEVIDKIVCAVKRFIEE